MAETSNIATGAFFKGEDKKLFVTITNASGAPQDITNWSLSYLVKKTAKASDAMLTKTMASGITITGTYNVDPTVNTQHVEIVFDDDDTTSLKAGAYYHELKRMDTGAESVLFTGTFNLTQAAHTS